VHRLLAAVTQRAWQHPEASALLAHARHRQRLKTDADVVIVVVVMVVMVVVLEFHFRRHSNITRSNLSDDILGRFI